jgi:hypothetical protein
MDCPSAGHIVVFVQTCNQSAQQRPHIAAIIIIIINNNNNNRRLLANEQCHDTDTSVGDWKQD